MSFGSSNTGFSGFGNNSNNQSSGSGLFGNQSNSQSNSQPSGGLFGSNNQSSSGGLFGANSNNAANPSTPNAKPTTGGLFGASNNTASGGLFGASNNTASGAALTSNGGLFGNQPKPSGGLFGNQSNENKPAFSINPPSADSSKSTTPAFLFGAKPEEKKDDQPAAGGLFGSKPATGFAFGAKPEEKKDDQSATGGLFGAKPAESKPATGGFSFGAKPEEKKDDKPAAGGLFGSKPTESKPATEEKKDDKPAAGGFSFGAKPEEKKDDKPVSFGAKPEEKKDDKPAPNKQEPNLKPTQIQPKPVSIDNMNMDDLILKWSRQLTTGSNIFQEYTERVKEWDQELVNSGEEITHLNQETLEAELLQKKIDQHLLFVENQQDELDQVLDNYEQQADILLNNIELNSDVTNSSKDMSSANGLSVTDKLREKAYHNAELLDERLDTLGDNLTTLINEINSVSDVFNKNLLNGFSNSEAKAKGENPVEEIVKLLNLHLDNLKYVEKQEQILQEKVAKASRTKKLQY
ncbi:hypothetical protein HYPBUDRAFT_105482 [Hyphopichia burtonii NRRL Y-1933]|uniref:Nucleoporin NSP1-like C-terminal domain-containing protein n=1 Tax=Hyphopichia burtonii NRRL Y-1933 TaxID=984485 RepID=A0A1E4RM80_9ASCO|nr:hypothetical protein HYPBUDRAFT_105482 [Hyphopichia burtonii NRRL Y-1933]ODV68377.1 hypothetical protein HYPBUDRAFT_105482 [Hyphopichia burtonii NRRL Y-1933]